MLTKFGTSEGLIFVKLSSVIFSTFTEGLYLEKNLHLILYRKIKINNLKKTLIQSNMLIQVSMLIMYLVNFQIDSIL